MCPNNYMFGHVTNFLSATSEHTNHLQANVYTNGLLVTLFGGRDFTQVTIDKPILMENSGIF